MIRKITLLFLACAGMFSLAQAQYCGFDQVHQQRLSQDPAYAQKVQQLNSNLHSLLQSNSNSLIINTPNGPVYEIPVVLHVIHTGGPVGSPYNPPTSQLTGMIDYLNKSYEATWPSYPNANNGGTFIPLRFVLAQRDPNCQPTDGINRVDGSSLPGYAAGGMKHSSSIGADEVDVKNLSRWPNTDYYNIWIISALDGEDGISPSGPYTAGFAWFPGAPANVDGTVMLASQAIAGEITLPHEIGHAFALYHTFQDDMGGTTCPPNADCSLDGDQVCDTDPHMRSNFNCPTNQTNPCTGNLYGTVVNNFMDYSSCQNRFTPGQRIRVINALLNSRGSLISSLGGTPISGSMPAACVPAMVSPISSNAGPRDIQISDASTTYMSVTSSGNSGDGTVYLDRTCKHMVDLTAGNTYSFSVRTGPNPENVKVFVDYNNDGVFQATEEIFSGAGTTPNQTHTFQYTVPTTAAVPDLISCVPLRMRVVSDRTTAPAVTACGPLTFGQAEDYSIIIRGGGPSTGAVTISLTSGTNPSCFSSPLEFTAVPSAGITNATYEWYVNNVNTGVTTNTFSSSTLDDNDVVNVKMYFMAACGNDSSMSASFIVHRQTTVPATVSIALTSGTNPGCAGQLLTFTATPQNGGTAPVYQWKVNGGNVGTNSDTFTSALNDNDVVTVEMISNSGCADPANAVSNSIVVTHTTIAADITIAQVGGTNPTCSGRFLDFEATVTDGGNNPQVQWFVNGQPTGASGLSFTTNSLTSNATITAVLTTSDPCVVNASDTSNELVIVVNPSNTPFVAATITQGSNPGCVDSLVEFSATVFNHGPNPLLEWLVNGTPVLMGPVFSTSTLFSGDVVTLRSIATDGACYTMDTAFSPAITMQRYSTPPVPTISLIGNMLVTSSSHEIIWYGPNGVVINVGDTAVQPTEAGVYYAVANNNGCMSAASNLLHVSMLDIATYNMDQVKVFPNPTTGMVTFDWGATSVNAKLIVYNANGQGLMFEEVRNESRKVVDLTRFAAGTYFIMIQDAQGNKGTVKVHLTK